MIKRADHSSKRADNTFTSIASSRLASRRDARQKRSTSRSIKSTGEVRPARKIYVVEFRSGEAVYKHPELAPLVKDGWEIESAVPDIADDGVKLLVVMIKSAALSQRGSVRAD